MAELTELLKEEINLIPVVWIGADSPVRSWIPSSFNHVPVQIESSVTTTPMAVFWNWNSAVIDPKQFEFWKSLAQQVPLILIKDHFSDQEINSAINELNATHFITGKSKASEFQEKFQALITKSWLKRSRSVLVKESLVQTKALEKMTESLEETVTAQTKDILISHEEEQSKLQKERQLVHFLTSLSESQSMEEVLNLLKKETRKFHSIAQIFLSVYSETSKTLDCYFSGVQGYSMRSGSGYELQFSEMDWANSLLQTSVATLVGRPLRKSWLVPLPMKAAQKVSGQNFIGAILIEFQSIQNDFEPLKEYFSERMRPLSLSLDRIYLESWLEKEAHAWEATFDEMRNPIAIISSDYQILRANQKFSKAKSPEDEARCFEVFAGRTSPCESCPMGQKETKEIRAEGRIYQATASGILISGMESVQNYVLQYLDVTQERKIYLQMIQNEKVQAMGALAGHIAHELNNPLTGIRSLSQVLAATSEEGSQIRKDLTEIEKAAVRCQKIIKNLMDFTGSGEKLLTWVSPESIVEDTIPLLKAALRHHSYRANYKTSGFDVRVEPQLLQQVVFNLIHNACQALPEKGIIQITTMPVELNETNPETNTGLGVEIRICDNGPGIPKDNEEKIFEPFFTTKKEGIGTGLGLSLSRTIVEKFKGTLCYEANPTGGACFVITLPAQRTATAGKAAQ